MENVEIYCINTDTSHIYPLGTSLIDISKDLNIKLDNTICGAIVNNQVKELSFRVVKPKQIEFIDVTHIDGVRMYIRSLIFVLYAATKEIFPSVNLKVEKDIANGLFCELEGLEREITDFDIEMISKEMQKLIADNIEFVRKGIPTDLAIKILQSQGLDDKALLFEQQGKIYSSLYFINDLANYFYGHLMPSTGYLSSYGLIKYFDGLLLQIPDSKNFKKLREVVPAKKLFDVYHEHKDWAEILNVSTIGHLNWLTEQHKSGEIIKISEALHEKRIAEIANEIKKKNGDLKIVLVAGPSASGKTTFSKRLSVQLAVNGLTPHQISLDDYFVNRELTPLDEHGEFDFESLYAINIELFNQQLQALLKGDEVNLPKFDFHLGKNFSSGNMLKLEKGDILIIEGIHGMNPDLIPSIDPKHTFKIFISALTQISYDEQNPIPTSDNRLIRRMIRDSKYRGYQAADTIKRWPSVLRGEVKNIFPYQENANVVFNSATLYELAVLKKYAEPILETTNENQKEYSEAKRLLKFLSYFYPINDNEIPPTSLLREFLGGSSFLY